MKNLFLTAMVAMLAIVVLPSCSKEDAAAPQKEQLPLLGTVESVEWFGADQTEYFIYQDDGTPTIELRSTGETSVIRTQNSQKTFYSFKMKKVSENVFEITFDENLVYVSNYGTGSSSTLPNTVVKEDTKLGIHTFSIKELDGLYELTNRGNIYSLSQQTGKHSSPAIIHFII